MDSADWQAAHDRLLDEIDAELAATAAGTGVACMGPALRAAMAAVPRHRFVPPAWRAHAYENRPLPIGHGQTISQPFIVALMTALLELRPHQRVLEIGTGCGYQAAVLSRLARKVVSLERVPELSDRASATLAALGLDRIVLHVADGNAGWPADAPYDAIIATAAPASLPPAWTAQLAPGGRLVAPVGAHDGEQWLERWRKDANGQVHTERLLGVRFVPLLGGMAPGA